MTSSYSAIDLSQLPFPNVIEQLSFEDIFSEMLNDLRARDENYSNVVESDPVYKLLQVAAYRETLLRQRVNNSAKAMTLAYAKDEDLDVVAANYNIVRHVIQPADTESVPPVPAKLESDDDLRRRVLLAFEGLTTAGSAGAYIFHTLSADADVQDATAEMTIEGTVDVAVLSRSSDGSAPTATLDAVFNALNGEFTRPLTDHVIVRSASINHYQITAKLYLYPGPDGNVVIDAANDAVRQFVSDNHRLGRDINLSGIYAALHQAGVRNVQLLTPTTDIINDKSSASYCNDITLSVGTEHE